MIDLDPSIRGILAEVNSGGADSAYEQIRSFADYLLQVNPKVSLISRQDSQALLSNLIYDSLVIASLVKFDTDASLLDIGSGAGIPGLIQKIARPDLTLCSVDSNRRKIEFQRTAAIKLALSNCRFVCGRIEAAAVAPCDYATAKAFGSVSEICHLAAPHLKFGGILILPRGSNETSADQQPTADYRLIDRQEYNSSLTGQSTLLLFRCEAKSVRPFVIDGRKLQ